MFKNPFSKPNPDDAKNQPPKSGTNPAVEAMRRTIAEKRKTDPLIGAKLGGRAVAQNLMSGLKDKRGIHIESLLCALGSLAIRARQVCGKSW